MKELEFVSGLTIEQALLRARQMAYTYNDVVTAIINDIVIIVYKGADIKKLMAEYQQKLQFKYEIENIKKQNIKTK